MKTINESAALKPQITQKGGIIKLVLRTLMRLDNLYYKGISRLASIAEGGIHPKHRLTNYHEFFIHNISSEDSVLDIGCGNGFLTYEVANKARQVTAIDIDKNNLEFARMHFNRPNITFIHGDATRLRLNERFDVIVLSNVLEHISNRRDFLLQIKKLSDRFLIRVPQLDRDWLTFYKLEMGVEYRLDPTHKIEYTMNSLREELEQAGIRIRRASVQFGEIWAIAERFK